MSSRRPGAFGLSRTGLGRERNEDRFLLHRAGGGLVAAVADGVHANRNGAVAATIAMRSLRGLDTTREPREALMSRALAADLHIRAAREADESLRNMCTTLTAVYVLDSRAVFVHAGDSRLYLVRGGAVQTLTRDHTVLQEFLENGDLTEAQAEAHPARNALSLCLGCPMLEPDSGELELEAGDVLLLCTDGLYGSVDAEAVARRLGGGCDLREGVAALAEDARRAGSRDDVTLVAVRV